MQDNRRKLIESRVAEIRAIYEEVARALCAAQEPREQNHATPNHFLGLYRRVSLLDIPSDKLSPIEGRVRRIKDETDALWAQHLVPAVKNIAENIRISSIRRNPDARADAASAILAKVYEKTLLSCVLNWRGEGQGVFTDYLRAAVANVRATYERKLWKRINREKPLEELQERASEHGSLEAADSRLTHDSLLDAFLARAGDTREAQVLLLHYRDELTHQQIAERLEISEENSRFLLHRAMRVLRDCAGVADGRSPPPKRSVDRASAALPRFHRFLSRIHLTLRIEGETVPIEPVCVYWRFAW